MICISHQIKSIVIKGKLAKFVHTVKTKFF